MQIRLDFPHPARIGVVVGWLNFAAHEDGLASRFCGALVSASSRLVREWRGVTHRVLVPDNGFEWRGERYASLSTIAREITGAHWSGPRFFGLRKLPSRPPAKGEPADAKE